MIRDGDPRSRTARPRGESGREPSLPGFESAPPRSPEPAAGAAKPAPRPARRARVFTDGSCHGNPGPGGWAAIVEQDGGRRELSGAERATTNNRMELRAVIEGLRSLAEPAQVEVWSDSRYVIDGMKSWLASWKARGWKTAGKQPVKNEDLWRALDSEAGRHRVSWHWVRGHDGHAENERADTLANAAIASLDR